MLLLDKFVGSHLADILLNEELKVSRWDELNDPFEGLHKLENYTAQEAREYFNRWDLARAKRGEPPLDLSGYNLDRDLDALRLIAHNEEILIGFGRDTLNQLYRIACFSKHESQKNPELARREVLMWAHYGNSQKGARIVFDAHSNKIPGYVGTVKYNAEPAELPLDALHRNRGEVDKKKKEQLIAPIYRKADVWDKENEQRIVVELKDVKTRYLNGSKFESIPFPIQTVRIVDFGINYSRAERDQLIQTLREGKGKHIQFRQCARKHNRYEFNFEPIA